MSTTSAAHNGVWEERWHPLREEWVIVAAHRQGRPWLGATAPAVVDRPPSYDPTCYLCPRGTRISGAQNPDYQDVYVFDNDHPCVGPEAPPVAASQAALPAPYRSRRADGIARVLCYSPRHDLTLAEMQPGEIAEIVQVWQQQTRDLGARPEVNQVLVFENKGEVVGVSNPHPHGQIYATNFVWRTFEAELAAMARYAAEQRRGLFAAIIAAEQADRRRIIYEDDNSIAFVPYFARYAYETYVAPKRPVAHFSDLRAEEVDSLARALQDLTVRFDNLWRQSFPYVMTLHQAPSDGGDYRDFHSFIGFQPPLRRPNTLKYLAGPEIGGGNFLSDTAPEDKAAELRAQSTAHYSNPRLVVNAPQRKRGSGGAVPEQ